jgi:hypothetical protein
MGSGSNSNDHNLFVQISDVVILVNQLFPQTHLAVNSLLGHSLSLWGHRFFMPGNLDGLARLCASGQFPIFKIGQRPLGGPGGWPRFPSNL